MPALDVGTDAPLFECPASNGKCVALQDYRKESTVVLYFYPKDDTSGCTSEAQSLRDHWPEISKRNAVVLGVSPDSITSHQKFIAKHQLPFLLLSDPKHDVCQQYGTWVEKRMYGRTYMGVARRTFIIGQTGKIAHIFKTVKPKEHGKDILTILEKLS